MCINMPYYGYYTIIYLTLEEYFSRFLQKFANSFFESLRNMMFVKK